MPYVNSCKRCGGVRCIAIKYQANGPTVLNAALIDQHARRAYVYCSKPCAAKRTMQRLMTAIHCRSSVFTLVAHFFYFRQFPLPCMRWCPRWRQSHNVAVVFPPCCLDCFAVCSFVIIPSVMITWFRTIYKNLCTHVFPLENCCVWFQYLFGID